MSTDSELEEVSEEETSEDVSEEETSTSADGLPIKKVFEGDLISFPNLAAEDPDGDELTYTFTAPLNDDGEWQTARGDAGEYTATITASDGIDEVSQDILIVVKGTNNAPEITPIRDFIVEEGDKISLTPIAKDIDGDNVTFTFSKPFSKDGVWETESSDVGIHNIEVTADDGFGGTSMVKFIVAVEAGNLPPIILGDDDFSVKEGASIDLEGLFKITDPEGDEVTIEYSGWFETATYDVTNDDAGKHTVVITASDGKETTSVKISITVENVNQKPTFNPGAFN